jgi:hypothetical protein
MEQIFETTDTFEFNKLTLGKPTTIAGGFFFIRYLINNGPLYVQPPKCCIKQIQSKSKKMYCDIVFKPEDEPFLQWIENLENRSQKIIYENREKWFENPLELEEIESSFTSPIKSIKSGKSYVVRTKIPTESLKIYDEDENDIAIESISENMGVMVILEIQGIRCSSSSFQIDIQLKQMMVLKESNLFNRCVFKKKEPESLGKPNPPEIPETPEPHKLPEKEMESEDSNDPVVLENLTTLDELCEVDIDIDENPSEPVVAIKDRKEMYYKMYDEARKKAKVARDLALSAYLEANQIKNKYMLDDLSSSSDEDEEN